MLKTKLHTASDQFFEDYCREYCKIMGLDPDLVVTGPSPIYANPIELPQWRWFKEDALKHSAMTLALEATQEKYNKSKINLERKLVEVAYKDWQPVDEAGNYYNVKNQAFVIFVKKKNNYSEALVCTVVKNGKQQGESWETIKEAIKFAEKLIEKEK